MSQFRIQFAYPWSGWLLLLLIPAIAVPLILHFKVAKKYRRTRNRIISLVLHLTVMILSVCALSGMIFSYHVDNPDNEILLLVDVSDTEEEVGERRDEFVQAILEDCGYDGLKTGVVTFGFDQVYAVPFGYDTSGMFEAYRNADLPDTSATDIAAALNYTASLFSGKGTSKIVLITDGKETDEKASSVIGTIAAQGVRVDAVCVSSDYDDTVQVVDVVLPDYHVNVGEECTVGVSLKSKAATKNTVIELYDNDLLDKDTATQTLDLPQGSQLVNFRCNFETQGLHELKVRIRQQGDKLEDNDEYFAYIYLEVYNKVLILERFEGESDELVSLLTTNGAEYEVDVKNLVTGDDIPSDIDTLRKYDQVILNNVSNDDLQIHEGLDRLLNTYVNEYGGGLLTVGGSEKDNPDAAHAYNREDMSGSLYQQMLPVQAIDYTPPVGVIFIIDTSSSMDSGSGASTSKRKAAQEGLIDLVRNQVLNERDYFGLMTLDTTYSVVLPLTRFTQQDVIENAIKDGLNSTGGTLYSQAIARARQLLFELKEVERRHIVLITDGMPAGDDKASYLDEARNCWETNGTTVSVIGFFSVGSGPYQAMEELTDVGHGRVYATSSKLSDAAQTIHDELSVPELKEVEAKLFNPIVTNSHSNVFNGVEYGTESDRDAMRAQLGGFYGVKVRDSDYLLLEGEYSVPIYAQWKYGAGSVGSFMCDLSGRWSSEFMHDDNGRRFLLNLVGGLMPIENIHPRDITYTLTEGNYFNRLSVDAKLNEGEFVRAEIVPVAGGDPLSLNTAPETADKAFYVTEYLTEGNGYSGCSFVIKRSGTYRIVMEKCAADGTVIETLETYKSFSFSKEYDLFAEEEDAPARDTLLSLAEKGGGTLIDDIEDRFDIIEGFELTLGRQFDPTMLFMILAMVLFLLDIVVRKFKFKWPHEIYREHKAKKAHG